MSKGLNIVIETIKFAGACIIIGLVATPVMMWLLDLFLRHFFGYHL